MDTTSSSTVRTPIEVRVDQGDGFETAATVFVPDRVPDDPIVIFGFPGGGCPRHMYFLDSDDDDYHEALWYARRGVVFVACDHLGVGDSTPLPTVPITWAEASAANHRTTTDLLGRMRNGGLGGGVDAFEPALIVGTGHSMGGMLLIHQQGTHHTFDCIAVVGASAIHTTPGRMAREAGEAPDFLAHRPEAVLAQLSSRMGPVILDPAELTSAGPVEKEAATITVPVFVGVGEVDVVPDLRAEPSAFSSSPDVTVTEVARMGHAYFLAETREVMWRRRLVWAEGVREMRSPS